MICTSNGRARNGRAALGVELAHRVVQRVRDRHALPRLASRDHRPLHRVVELEVRVVELVGVEVLLGVEDLADADVAGPSTRG
jgi:hypothetical protein